MPGAASRRDTRGRGAVGATGPSTSSHTRSAGAATTRSCTFRTTTHRLRTPPYGSPYATVRRCLKEDGCRPTTGRPQPWRRSPRGASAPSPSSRCAARLGATKGSFYWHFRNRDALLEAALQRWERLETDDVIARVETEPDPRRRLRKLFFHAIGGGLPGKARTGSVEPALQAAAAHPLVAPVLARVTRRRLDYLDAQFRALGLPPAVARHRALLAYTAYLGHTQLAHATPGITLGDLDAYADDAIAVLTM